MTTAGATDARAGRSAPPRAAAVSVRGLVKRYGNEEVVKGIELDVAPGETFGFLGPNGAGKSTTINILCTLLAPTAGRATVAGFDVVRERNLVRRHIGLVFQETTLDGYLTAEQNLRFHAELYRVPRATIEQRIRTVLDVVGLADRRNAKVATFSGGMKRRLEIARGILHSPRVLFLDEPTIGLDPQTRSSIWAHIAELKRSTGVTVFMTTHYMDEAEFCDRIAIIDHGEIVMAGAPDALKDSVGADRVTVTTADAAELAAVLRDRFRLEAAVAGDTVTFSVENGERFVPILCAAASVAIRSVGVRRPSLDHVFLSVTGRTIRDGEAPGRPGWGPPGYLAGGR